MNGSLPNRRHLRRLDRSDRGSSLSIYLVTTCTRERRPLLIKEPFAREIGPSLETSGDLHGWTVGRYVIMPDHIHFFCRAMPDSDVLLTRFVGNWKSYVSHRAAALGLPAPLWQPEFHDHLLRNSESYRQKWEYVRANPVRAGLCSTSDAWPWKGEIAELEW